MPNRTAVATQQEALDLATAADIQGVVTDSSGRNRGGSVRGRGGNKSLRAQLKPKPLWKQSTTYPTQPKTSAKVSETLDAVIGFGLDAYLSGGGDVDYLKVLMYGKHGTGKTSTVVDAALRWATVVQEETGHELEVIYIPAQTKTVDDLMLIGVDTDEAGRKILTFTPYRYLANPNTVKVLVIDELSRAEGSMKNQCLELIQDGRINDVPLPGIVAAIAMMNLGPLYSVKSIDYALASRFTLTLAVETDDTEWDVALANTFPDLDLADMLTMYRRGLSDLDKDLPEGSLRLHDVLVPRTLEHMLWCLEHGFPAKFALPMPAGAYVKVAGADGSDLLPDALARLTHAAGYDTARDPSDKFATVMRVAFETGKNVHFCSLPGASKTASARAWFKRHHPEVDTILFHGANTNPDSMTVPIFNDGHVDVALLERLRRPGKKVIILDDWNRAEGRAKAQFMEILQEGSVSGERIEDLVMIVAFSNPPTVAGIKQNVSKPDAAQADRFFANVFLTDDDLHAAEYLLATYGEAAAQFIEWREDDLEPEQRELCNFRVLESLILADSLALDLADALPLLNKVRIPVPLHDLRRRLDDKPAARLKYVAANVDVFVEAIRNGDQRKIYEIASALRRAQPSQLKQHFDAAYVLMPALRDASRRSTLGLLRAGGPRMTFWYKVLAGEREEALRILETMISGR